MLTESQRTAARARADHFLAHETAFRLGALPTEQSHPKTASLSQTTQRDIASGIALLQSVDADLIPVMADVFAGEPYAQLVRTLTDTLSNGGRIIFTGCGATGRLSILLEAAWRGFWQEFNTKFPDACEHLHAMEHRVLSVMAGGDYALIRSVEGYEDYTAFGRHQLGELNVTSNDAVVAITEGGETSFVIGTAWAALEVGARAFFVYNNPTDILAAHVERSRAVINEPAIVKLDLSTGPMAVAGSTRMQATTTELLVVGAALESALMSFLSSSLTTDQYTAAGLDAVDTQPLAHFADLLTDLSQPAAVSAQAQLVRIEQSLYEQSGLITYIACDMLLDILTDTTERAPTFMLPPFRKSDDTTSPSSWAFVKHLYRDTPTAWQGIFRRGPRCVEWDAAVYRALDAPSAWQQHPLQLGVSELLKFPIGFTDDPARYDTPANAAMLVLCGDELSHRTPDNRDPVTAFVAHTANYADHFVLAIGPESLHDSAAVPCIHVPCALPASPLGLWDHLAVKLVLNTISTATMAAMGRVVGNWMVHVETTNKKLIDRSTRLVAELTGLSYAAACHALHETIEQLDAAHRPGVSRPSAVAVTIERLAKGQSS